MGYQIGSNRIQTDSMKRYLLISWLILHTISAFSAIQHTSIEILGTSRGLGNNTVYCIHKDQKGFMWFGTDLGISRYDGQQFQNFTLNSKPASIKQFYETPNQLFWLLSINGKLYCFDKNREQNLPVSFSPNDSLMIFNQIQVINDTLLYAASKQGLFRLKITQQQNKSGKAILIQTEKETAITGLLTSIVIDDKKEKLYTILENTGNILEYELNSGKIRTIDISRLYPQLKETLTQKIHLYGDYLWISKKWAGIICYNLKTGHSRLLEKKKSPDGDFLQNTNIIGIACQNKNSYFFATFSGICQVSFSETPDRGEFTIDKLSGGNDYTSITENEMLSAYYDPVLQLLWVGSFGSGIIKFDLNDIFYNQIYINHNIQLKNITEDSKGYIWLTTRKKGIWKSDQNTVNHHTTFSQWKGGDTQGNYSLYKDKNGNLWFGDENFNILYVEASSGKKTDIKIKPEGMPGFHAKINGFYLDSRERLWIATEEGLICYNRLTENCICLLPDKYSNYGIKAVTEDSKGQIWLGTERGLIRLDISANSINYIDGFEKQVNLSPSLVYALYVNSLGQVIASYADKVLRISQYDKDKVDAAVSLQKGLPNGQVYCITEDQMGSTWFGTNSGILTVKSGELSFYNYSFSGNNTDVCHLHDQRLLWTNTSGLLFFDPSAIKKNSKDEQLFISNIEVNHSPVTANEIINKQVILPLSATETSQLEFNHQNNNFTLYFSNLQYSPIQQKIAYRLLPGMQEWVTTTFAQGISFNHLKAGKYTLQVHTVFYDESQGSIKEIGIRIFPHWSGSWWAQIIYLLLAIIVLYNIRRYLIKLKKARKQEIRLKEELFDNHMKLAYRNTIGMQDTCNQLLDIYKQACLSEDLEIDKWNITDVTDNIVKSFHKLLKTFQIDFHYEKEEVGLWLQQEKKEEKGLWFDKQKIEFILRNILSNAFRHISYSGKICLKVKVDTIDNTPCCLLRISDDGTRIVKKNINKLFPDPIDNEKIDMSDMALGYPLLMKIIELHHWRVDFQSDKESGTQITIFIPFGKKHFENDANVTVKPNSTGNDLQLPPIMEKDTGPESPGNRKKILVVEDNKDIQFYLQVIFSPNYTVIQAKNGQEGVDLAQQEIPDIVLCDVTMPVKDGFTCCREIKEHLHTCHIPVIMLTARAAAEDIIQGTEYGADDYILKPFNPEILKAKVSNLIKSRSELKQNYIRLMFSPEENGQNEKRDSFMTTVLEIIEQNIQETDFSVKKLADAVNMSQPTLYRKIKQSTDLTIIELIRSVRLKKAAELLKQQDYGVQEVAELVGYNDIPSFRKHFTDLFGTTPSTYAKSQNK